MSASPSAPAPPAAPVVLHSGVYRIGRAPDNDFVLPGRGIAAYHCRITVRAGGARLKCTSHAGAVAIDGRTLPPNYEAPLPLRGTLLLGTKTFQIDLEAAPASDLLEAPSTVARLDPLADGLELRTERAATGIRLSKVFAGYRVEAPLGGGGTAEVFRALRLSDHVVVALKVFKEGVEFASEATARLYREACIGSALAAHPGVVKVYEAGRHQRRSYIVFEHVAGADLQSRIERAGPLPAPEAVDVALQVADCLRFAHRLGIIHRDIKPSNLMLDEAGRVRLLDLGLARALEMSRGSVLTSDNLGLGSLCFVSPEQAGNAAAVDHRSDMYSLGATLFALITGVPPIVQRSLAALCQKIVTEKPPTLASVNPALPPTLSATVERCLEKDPARRYAEYDDLLRDLETARRELDVCP